MTLRDLLAVFVIERTNFQVLHWTVAGHGFDNMHNKVTNDYYEMVSKDIDDIAEMAIRCGLPPVGYEDAYQIAKTAYPQIITVSPTLTYQKPTVVKYSNEILKTILDCIGKVLNTDAMQKEVKNVGIKAYLEGLFDKYDKEYRFLNKRRFGDDATTNYDESATEVYTEASIEDSYIYKSFNASNALIDKIVKYIKTSVALDTTYFEEQYMQMKKIQISPLSKKVVNAYDNGEIELLFSRETKVGISIPFIIRKNEKGNIVATIFIASFTTLDKNDSLAIPVKQLYALMESAYIGLQLQVNPTKLQRNTGIMKICTSVWTQMMMRLLNKEYSLSLDKELMDKVTYVLNRFFLTNIWGYPNLDLVDSYSRLDLKFISQLDLDLTSQAYKDATITDVNELIVFLSSLSPRMKELNTRYFIERYVNTFHGSSILSIDYLPYVFFVIVNVLLGSFLISQTALNDLIKNTKGMNMFYSELAKTI